MAADRRLRVALAGDGDAAVDAAGRADGPGCVRARRVAGARPAEPLDVAVLVHDGDAEPREQLAHLREHTGAPVVLATTAPVERARPLGARRRHRRRPLAAGVGRRACSSSIEKAARTARQPEPGGAGRVVTVFSPKGGSGKSVVSTNLAVAAATHAGRKTLLIDLDLQFGDAAIMLGLAPDNTVRELIGTPTALDGEKLGVYTERHSSGVACCRLR